MRAWVVHEPGAIDGGPLRSSSGRGPSPGRARCACGCRCAGCAGPTSTSPRATCRRTARRGARPRDRRRGRRARAGRAARFAVGDRIGVAWLRHTCGQLPLLPAGRREPVRRARASPAGTPTAATPSTRSSTRLRLPAARRVRRRAGRAAAVRGHHRLPRAAARPSCRPAAGSASTGSAAPPTSPRRSRSPRARRARADPVGRRPGSWRSTSARRRAGDAPTRRPSRWTPRSCSPRPASWSRSRWRALDRGGTLAVAGIHLSDIPPLDYQRHLFQERQLRSVTANTRADGEEFLRARRRHRHPGRRRSAVPASTTPTEALGRPGRRPRRRAPPCCTSVRQEARGERFRATLGVSARL